jgi:hypothetical protein
MSVTGAATPRYGDVTAAASATPPKAASGGSSGVRTHGRRRVTPSTHNAPPKSRPKPIVEYPREYPSMVTITADHSYRSNLRPVPMVSGEDPVRDGVSTWINRSQTLQRPALHLLRHRLPHQMKQRRRDVENVQRGTAF